jgi:hypothetical protein
MLWRKSGDGICADVGDAQGFARAAEVEDRLDCARTWTDHERAHG